MAKYGPNPATDYINITDQKSDTIDLSFEVKAFLSDADGLIKVTNPAGRVVEDYPAQKGYNPAGIKQLWSTGTDSGLTIVGLWDGTPK